MIVQNIMMKKVSIHINLLINRIVFQLKIILIAINIQEIQIKLISTVGRN